MCGGDVERVAIQKSARVGYTKCLMAASAYWLCYKKRSVGVWSPVDDDRTNFVKKEIEPAIRDVPAWRDCFPAFEKQHRDNTTEYKKFQGCFLQAKGGKSARNFRGDTLSVAILDEFDAFDADIDSEGSALELAEKRTEGAKFPKLIVGSTPKEKGFSQIESAVEGSEVRMRFHVPCPHCDEAAPITFKSLKWDGDDPDTVSYECRSCEKRSSQSEMTAAQSNGFWHCADTGIGTRDGLDFTHDGETVHVRSVGYYIWAGYSHIVHWRSIVAKWTEAQAKPLKLKTYVNQTLGETWDDAGEKVSKNKLQARVEKYDAELPSDRIVVVTAGVDVQRDRFEVQWIGWAPGQEAWILDYKILPAQTDQITSWKEILRPKLFRSFSREGRELETEAVGIDTGGSATQTAYDYCREYVSDNHLALKGLPGDKPIMPMRAATNWKKRGLEGWGVGVDTAKAQIFEMLNRHEGGPASFHFPDEGLPEDYFDQLTVERKVEQFNRVTGKRSIAWRKPEGRLNEALDVTVYGIAALQFLKIQRYLDLDERFAELESGDESDGWDEVY